MSLLPSRGPDASASQDGELQIVGVDEDVSAVLDALSSETAREILNSVYDEPGTPSELADRLDMSIQKVSYHLEKLEDEELITVAGIQYSEKGQEMKVYEPPEDPLVLFVGTQDRKRSLRSLAKRLIPVVGLLTAASVVVQLLMGQLPFGLGSPAAGGDVGTTGAGGSEYESQSGEGAVNETTEAAQETPTPEPETDDSAMEVAEATETPTPEADTPVDAVTEQARELTTEAAASGSFEMEPGLAFFLGGILVLTVVLAYWAYGEYR